MTDVLITPSIYLWTRDFMLSELASRSITMPWFRGVPESSPDNPRPERFCTIEPLNTRQTEIFYTSVLTQIEVWDTDEERGEQTAELVSSLWDVMPAGLQVWDVEHAGGPTPQKDDQVPFMFKWLITKWVSVMKSPA